jgi:LysM repeat protein
VPGLLIGAGVILVGVVAMAAILGGGRSPGIAVISPSPVTQRTGSPGGQATSAPVPTHVASVGPVSTPAPTSPPSPRPARTVAATEPPATPPRSTPDPAVTPRPEPTATVQPTPTPEIARRYTVKEGDTIKSIANKFGLKPRDLRAVNTIGKEVVVGQRLRIPARSIPAP